MDTTELHVIKRSGCQELVSFDKILRRVRKLGEHDLTQVQYTPLVKIIIDQLYNNIPTHKIDELTAEQCAIMSTHNNDYSVLASRIIVSNHQKNTNKTFYETCLSVSKLLNPMFLNYVSNHQVEIEKEISYERDFLIDYFGFKTLEKSYLLKSKDQRVAERPQHLWMRVALSIHPANIDKAFETYHLMSQKYFTHATPTLFNAGSSHQQLSSCFLLAMEEDSIEGIFRTLSDCARISKWSGGIGLHIHNVRSNRAEIKSTNGISYGIIPMLKLFNDTARFVNQGGKRNGSFAIYLETWHSDIEDFLTLKNNHGDEDMKARDLFYGLWVSDLFMKRISEDKMWSLMCPSECPGLSDVYSDDFEALYIKYEMEHKYKKQIPARDLWFKILEAQMETGNPYILYKDAVNMKSNQKNLGTIKSSNLCCEVTLYTSPKESAVCNLASIALPAFIHDGAFDYEKLHKVTKIITENLNNIIDINFYPTEKSKRSNLLHRPIGIGVQGLADTFALLNMSYDSEEAQQVNYLIFETIYHGALERSNELAKDRDVLIKDAYQFFVNNTSGALLNSDKADYFFDQVLIAELESVNMELNNNGSYSSFKGSPASFGTLQYDLWGKTNEVETKSKRYDWQALKQSIMKYGLRNSTLLAPMPTASTSQILGYNECFEPFTSNIYSRHTIAGEFMMANKYLIKELCDNHIWNDSIKKSIIENKGSIQQLIILKMILKQRYQKLQIM